VKKSSEYNGLVAATVTYDAPLHVPGVTRFLGHRSPRGGRYFVVSISSTASLPDE